MDGAAAMLAETWPSIGARDEAAKDLTGMLLRAGWDVEETDQFVTLVARIAGDEEWRKRAKAKHTAAKLAAGGHVTGARQLATRLQGDGEKVVALVQRWLNLPTPGRTRVSASGWPGRSADARLPGRPGGFGGLGADEGMADLDEQVVSVSYNAVEVRRVAWLWEGRIPLGAITLLDGDPGLGKSLLTLDLAARITTGREMPDGTPGLREGAGVVLLSAEDDPGVTIAPRLRAAGADLARVEGVRGMTMRDPETGLSLPRSFLLPQDIPQLEEVIERVWARLVVIDPLMAYLDDRVNSWRDQDVRATLAPLADLAERTGAAILILRHLNKSVGGSALYRGGGSIGIVAAARSGLLVAKHPDDPDHERVLAATKSNLGPPVPALRYRVTAQDDHDAAGDATSVPYLEWLGECDLSAEQALAASSLVKAGPSPSKVAEALEWLYGTLAEGARPRQEVEQDARAMGISGASLRRAREQLGVRTERRGYGPEMRSWWSLSEEDMPAGGQPPAARDGAVEQEDTPVMFTPSSHVQPPLLNTTAEADEHD